MNRNTASTRACPHLSRIGPKCHRNGCRTVGERRIDSAGTRRSGEMRRYRNLSLGQVTWTSRPTPDRTPTRPPLRPATACPSRPLPGRSCCRRALDAPSFSGLQGWRWTGGSGPRASLATGCRTGKIQRNSPSPRASGSGCLPGRWKVLSVNSSSLLRCANQCMHRVMKPRHALPRGEELRSATSAGAGRSSPEPRTHSAAPLMVPRS